ncbi:hypothetical protein K501DRAFT_269166 [Backusella circina FSU 941]|nr:hypothetical protein K501DRAFT_269166 [Backusella circina FSU 941]
MKHWKHPLCSSPGFSYHLECRKRWRKCIRNSLFEICSRCKHLDKKCTDSDEELEEEPHYNEYDTDMPRLQQQVKELTLLLEEMEKATKGLSPQHQDNDDKQLIVSNNVCNRPWHLTFLNGTLRIETSIRSISDLLIQCSPTRYLSPFQSTKNQDALIVQFDSGKTIRFMPLTIKLLVKCVTPALSLTPSSSFLYSPATLDIDSIVERLVCIFFQCRNTHIPLVHERTFIEHYRGLISPLDSLVCLSICCSVCHAPCNHTTDDPYTSRELGDFFYGLAKAKLMDQFDERSKRLENLICINLLKNYMLTVLKLDDFKNLVTIGFRICLDLTTWFNNASENQGVEQMLYSRHFFAIFLSQGLVSLITSEPMHYLSMPLPEWIVMEDEPQEVAHFISIQNHLIRLYNHTYLANVKMQIQHQLKGDPFSLKFESIIRMDDVLREWWESVPLQYKICEDWLNVEQAKTGIDRCDNDSSLILFNYSLAFMMDIYSALLQPSALGTSNNQILSVVQEFSLRRSLDCCELLIYSQFKSILLSDTLSCQSILNLSEYLFHTLDALIIMIFSTNSAIRVAAKEMLAQSQSLIDHVHFMQSHQVKSVHSPLLASVRANDINSIDLSVYFSYPQPWFAMLYDLAHHLDKIRLIGGVPFLVDV